MSRIAWIPVFVALIALGLLLPASSLAGEIKSYPEHGFEIELPSGTWQHLDPNSNQQEANYVTGYGRRDGESVVILWIRVQPTLESTVAELTENTRGGLRGSLPAVQDVAVKEGSVSGIRGTLVIVKGKDNRDLAVVFRVFTIQSGNRFYQLLFRFGEGAEKTQARAADALRRGFRLKEGAGPKEEPEKEFLEGAGEESAPEEEPEDGDVEPIERDGNTLTFPHHNLKWTIPDGSPFEWKFITADAKKDEQTLCRAEAKIEHPPKGDEEEPVVNTAVIVLNTGPQKPGWTPNGVVNHLGNQEQIEKNAFDKGTLQYARTKAQEDIDIGNHTGAVLLMVGAKDKKVFFFRLYAVGLMGRTYLWEVHLKGDRNAERDFLDHVEALLETVEFQTTKESIRGPLAIRGVPPSSSSDKRGSRQGEEAELKRSNFEATKPAEMYQLKFDGAETGGMLRLAWEMRTEDGESYLYYDLQTLVLSDLRKKKIKPEKIVKDREGLWRQVAESPSTIKKGKNPWYKASYAKGRGVGYEFKGYLGETPFLERGFVVTYKKHVYWVRYQFGGRDAESKFAPMLKKLKKALKLLKG